MVSKDKRFVKRDVMSEVGGMMSEVGGMKYDV